MFDAGIDELAAAALVEDGAGLQRLDADADERARDDRVRKDVVEIRGQVGRSGRPLEDRRAGVVTCRCVARARGRRIRQDQTRPQDDGEAEPRGSSLGSGQFLEERDGFVEIGGAHDGRAGLAGADGVDDGP